MYDRESAMFAVALMVACEAFELPVQHKLLVLASGAMAIIARKLFMPCRDFFPQVGDKPVLITGCDTGFGNLLAQYLDHEGVTVFAGCLRSKGDGANKLRKKCSSRLHIVQMDVTSESEVANAVDNIKNVLKHKELWGIVNNAGLNYNGDIELNTMAQFSQVLQINYLGMVRVTKSFLPLIKRSKGRIVNVSSVRGRVYAAHTAPYSSSKFAAEAFSDILRQELSQWGIKVCIIEPGNFGGATGCLEMNRVNKEFKAMWDGMSSEVRGDYGYSYIEGHLNGLKAAVPTASFNLMPVIEAMYHSLFSLNPEKRYLIPGSSKMFDIFKWLSIFSPFIPTFVYDRLLLWSFSSEKLVPECLKEDS